MRLPLFDRFIWCAVICLFAGGGSLSAGQVQDHKKKDGFTITIPDGWNEVPHEKMVEMTETLKKQAAGAPVPDFSYGYQLKNDNWFVYPYVLVWVKRNGRIPDRDLAQLDNPALTKQVQKGAKDYEKIVSGFQMGKPVFDSVNHIIWVNTEANYPGAGRVGMLNAAILTEQGSIWIYGYAPVADFEKHKPTFIEIVRSVELTEALKYQPHAKPGAAAATATSEPGAAAAMPEIPKPIPQEEGEEPRSREDAISQMVGVVVGAGVGIFLMMRFIRKRKPAG